MVDNFKFNYHHKYPESEVNLIKLLLQTQPCLIFLKTLRFYNYMLDFYYFQVYKVIICRYRFQNVFFDVSRETVAVSIILEVTLLVYEMKILKNPYEQQL